MLPIFIVSSKPPPWAVVIVPWGYCPKECPC
ncbi:rfbP protein [Vibrio sp. 1180_3]|nr:rfbP protein [Vibrio sp. 1180_3]